MFPAKDASILSIAAENHRTTTMFPWRSPNNPSHTASKPPLDPTSSVQLTICQWCNRPFKSLAKHGRYCPKRPSELSTHHCYQCNKGFATFRDLKQHKRSSCQARESPQWACPFCGSKFVSEYYITNHLRKCPPATQDQGEWEHNGGTSRRGRMGSLSPALEGSGRQRSASPAPSGGFHSCQSCEEWFGNEADCRNHERTCQRSPPAPPGWFDLTDLGEYAN